MWFIAAIFLSLIFVAYQYFAAGNNFIKMQNLELVNQVDKLSRQLDLVMAREQKARHDADLAGNTKSKLLSVLSHEIRTPMNGIIGMGTLLAETNLSQEQREYTDTVLDCSKTLLHNVNEILINDMLDLSKIDSESSEQDDKNFSLRICVEEVMTIFSMKAAEAGIDLLYQVDPAIPVQLTGNYKRLQKILINLVENALKFTVKGEIFVAVKLLNNSASNQIQLEFTVSDTGTGVAPEKLPELFKGALPKDFRINNSQRGQGFGLVICKRLAEQMGGQITLENRPGQGCSFIFNVNIQRSGEPSTDFTFNQMVGFEGKQILVVDDNANGLSILNNELEQWRLLPVLASSGKHAMEILSQISVDLIITDLLTPEMDGIELSKLIKEQYPKIPIILLNAVNDERYKHHPDIFNAVIKKPVKQQNLFDSVLGELRHHGTASTSGTPQGIPADFSEKYPLKILVAEDNPINQKWIKKILSKIGYQCEIAENGKVVLETVSHEHFDLILMDVQMPLVDGMEATRMIRVCLEVQPVIIAMTANVMQGDRDECIQSGMNDYISKPVELNILLNVLKKWALFIKEKKHVSKRENSIR